jgi:hypothetical protein
MQDCMIRRDREVQKSKEIPDDDEVASLLESGSHEQSWPSSPAEIGCTRSHILVGGTIENVLRPRFASACDMIF